MPINDRLKHLLIFFSSRLIIIPIRQGIAKSPLLLNSDGLFGDCNVREFLSDWPDLKLHLGFDLFLTVQAFGHLVKPSEELLSGSARLVLVTDGPVDEVVVSGSYWAIVSSIQGTKVVVLSVSRSIRMDLLFGYFSSGEIALDATQDNIFLILFP